MFFGRPAIAWQRSSMATYLRKSAAIATGSLPRKIRRRYLGFILDVNSMQGQKGPGGLNEKRSWPLWPDRQPWSMKSDYYFALFRKLKEAGITIPFPQRDLHLQSVSPGLTEKLKELMAPEKG